MVGESEHIYMCVLAICERSVQIFAYFKLGY